MLFVLYILGGGVTGGATNLLIPKDAPDRYTGSMAIRDWDDQEEINEKLLLEHKELRVCIQDLRQQAQAIEATLRFFDYKLEKRNERHSTPP